VGKEREQNLKGGTEMDIGLKNVKTWQGREGQGFQASLYINSVRTAVVTNDAFGGEFRYDVLDIGWFAAFKEHVAGLPPYTYHGQEFPMDMDIVIEDALCDWQDAKQIKRLKKRGKAIVARNPDGGLWSWNLQDTEENRQRVLAKYPEAVIL
jgi:hypothetical protein